MQQESDAVKSAHRMARSAAPARVPRPTTGRAWAGRAILVLAALAAGSLVGACRQIDSPAPMPKSAKPPPALAAGCETDGGLDCPPECSDYFAPDDGGFTSCGSTR
ncbi:MAG: hypothetical protein IT373_21475 [Polyangiaceae bacterium]|nr:hypothetical protein [Polyangiaceae bacterium]